MAHADNSNVYDVAFEMLVARTGQNDLALQLRTGDEDFEQGERWPQACKRFASVALMLYGERPRTNLTRWVPKVPTLKIFIRNSFFEFLTSAQITRLSSGCPWEGAVRESVQRDLGL